MVTTSKTIIDRQNEEKDLFIEALSEVPIISWACGKSEVPRSTIYRWQKEDRSFLERMKIATKISIAKICDKAEINFIQAIQNNDLKASKYYLEKNKISYSPSGVIHGEIKTADEIDSTDKMSNQLRGLKETIW